MEAELKIAPNLIPAVQSVAASIRGLNPELAAKAQHHIDTLTKPIGSLGRLEAVTARICRIA